jgi:hypothetical protein
MQDPDLNLVKQTCSSLVGGTIQLNATMQLPNGTVYSIPIANCNIVGDMLENLLFPALKSVIPTMEEGPKQASPDFYNRNGGDFEYELKAFQDAPGFDVSNFKSYIDQLSENLERKMFRTKYLIFKYSLSETTVTLCDFKMVDVWAILNYSGKYPVSIQSKSNVWYNLRPCVFGQMGDPSKTPAMFIEHICKAIVQCPNNIENKNDIIEKIQNQFITYTQHNYTL